MSFIPYPAPGIYVVEVTPYGSSPGGGSITKMAINTPASLLYNLSTTLYNNTQQIYSSQTNSTSSAILLTSDSNYHSWRPKWSPSGDVILFNRNPSTDANYDLAANFIHTSLWVMGADGTGLIQIIAPQQVGGGSSFITTANWLADGRILVEISGLIYILNPDGTNLVNLPTIPGFTDWSDICCSPDNTLLIGRRGGNGNLYGINLATGVCFALTVDGGSPVPQHYDPQFTPDGQWVAFESLTNTSGNFGLGQWQIEKMRPDGSERTIISPTTGVIANPVIDLDGWCYCQNLTNAWNVSRFRFDGSSGSSIVSLTGAGISGGYPDVRAPRRVPTTQMHASSSIAIAANYGNSSSETSILSAPIPAFALHGNNYFRIRAMGLAKSKSSSPGNLTMNMRFGPTSLTGQVLAQLVFTPTTNVSSFAGISFEGMFVCHTAGPAGTAVLGGQLEARSGTYISTGTVINTAQGAINTTVDTTVNNVLEITLTWQTQDPANTITLTHVTIEPVIRP